MANYYQDFDASVPSFSRHELQSIEIFEADLKILARQWVLLDHISSFTAVGDYKVFQLAGESVVIVRNEQGFSGFLNFCLHRGAKLCTKSQGRQSAFTCPYHAWRYDLTGVLQQATACTSKRVTVGESRLNAVSVRVEAGLIFASLQAEHSTFSASAELFAPFLAWHNTSAAKIAGSKRFVAKGNWKLFADNFFECYHCRVLHPEMCELAVHPKITSTVSTAQHGQYMAVAQDWFEKVARLGHPVGERQSLMPELEHFSVMYRVPVDSVSLTLSKTGQLVAPLMGEAKVADGGETFGYLGPLTLLNIYNDYGYSLRLNPISVDETELILTWFVAGDAVEGKDYQFDEVSWFWQTTVQQDLEIIELARQGTSSRFFQPGDYTMLEADSAGFASWYRRQLQQPKQVRESDAVGLAVVNI
ncbi:MAG: aromatic ring-hydroxylating dioxygenase subunit alpha [Gammaproteobacteria bacterium]|nr:aromatic ring-hydroxylating dioxygenase subunit alpha [Gammaproteobacteria bacterium]MBU1555380.1 aromatic ring-hydroxylating dioxygenase subunit alpha [Gammaproteobacteria bacterium]MBU2070544.1 aromatic ring-hydroxylating dioxygenase subunit alpha [Gammaproteobacteria bacterium]MBU2185356.1 aromatic ring-hydroxylating dioxygenase subunit alpha [Gammaproteobacteria bacterium]MBU2207050.1 aromatic ring-hydroxylating dioxygenase subunit alpha [Gammaproteobacteria bacterium]